MIEAKNIEFTKLNKLDFGYTLCEPYDISGRSKEVDPDVESELVRKITHADRIFLILSNYHISGRIREELEWASKYIAVDLIANSQKNVGDLQGITLHSIKIDPSALCDYISITDEMGMKYCYSLNGPYRAGEGIELAYSQKVPTSDLSLEVLNEVSSAIISGKGSSLNNQVYKYCKKNNIPLQYMVDSNQLTPEVYDKTEKAGLELLTASNINDGVYGTRNGYLFKIVDVNNVLVRIPVADIKEDTSTGVFKNLRLKNEKKVFPKSSFVVRNGEISELDVRDTDKVEITLDIPTMEDFVNEKFDISAADKRDSQAKNTKYVYTLRPPYFDERTFTYSSIYDEMEGYISQWETEYQHLQMEAMRRSADAFFDVHNKGYATLAGTLATLSNFNDVVEGYGELTSLKNYHSNIHTCRTNVETLISDADSAIRDTCEYLMSDSFNSKMNAFNEQINKNNEVISKIESTPEGSLGSFSNKSRVEAKKLENKKLIEQRDDFLRKNKEKAAAEVDNFLAECKNPSKPATPPAHTVKQEKSKLDYFKDFMVNYYGNLMNSLPKLSKILEGMEKQDFPEDYVIYDHAGKRYIQIDSAKEYKQTKDIRSKYGLECVSTVEEDK